MANPENIIGKGFDVNPQNANRNGRPKGSRNRRTIYREHLEKLGKSGQVVDDIVLAAIDKALAGDINALKELMDSGYGKVADKQEISGPDGSPIETRAIPDTGKFLAGVAGMGEDTPPAPPSKD